MLKQINESRKSKSLQTAVDILNSRVLKATFAFKQFLTDHQQIMKEQEQAKTVVQKTPFGVKSNRGKMKILPAHNYTSVSTAESENDGGALALEIQETYHQERATSIETIEKTLYDITTLFKRFANIVQEHQVLVERIDANTENAMHDLEGANNELREVYENTKSSRKLMLKIFFILMLFATFYILFVL